MGMATNVQEKTANPVSYQVCLRSNEEFNEVWNKLPPGQRSEVVVKVFMHGLRCGAIRQELHFALSLAAQEVLWGRKEKE